jgi:dipeptidase
VAELRPNGGPPTVAWCSLTTPCTAAFLPILPGTPLPEWLTTGTGEPDPRSAWWTLKQLGDAALRDPVRRTPAVQAVFGAWEAELLAETARDPHGAGPALAGRVAELRRRQATLHDRLLKEDGS